MRISIVLLFMSISICSLSAQINDRQSQSNSQRPQNNQGRSNLDSLIITREDSLSSDVFSYSLDNLSKKTYFNDTTLTDFEEYEMTEQAKRTFITLGNPGSSANEMFWQQNYQHQFNLGFNQHDIYKMRDEDIRFYDLEKAYSKVYFSPGNSQSSFRAKALLARDFANNLSFSLHYNRINSEPIYDATQVRHTSFHVGIYQRIDSSRWAYSLNFLSNSNFEQLNGGIIDKNEFNAIASSVRNTINVNLTDVYSYQLSRDYSARVYYFIKDTTKSKQYFQFKLNHDRGLYKFINEDITSSDSLFFPDSLIISELGMRRHIKNNRSQGKLSYHLESPFLRSQYYVRYALNQLKTDLGNRNISEIVGGGENEFEWKGLNLNLSGYFGTVYNRVLLDLHPKIGLKYKDFASINAGFRIHTEPSGYQLNNLELTFENIVDNDPFTLSSQELYGEVKIPIIGLSGKVSSYAGQNIPALDSTGMEVERINVEYLMFDLEEKLNYNWFHFDNRFVTQIRSNEIYDMPAFYAQSSMYFKGYLFEALNFQSGIKADFVPAYSLPSYSPLYGRYYQSQTPEEGFFYRIDVYASIKVQGFRFFAKYENLNDLWSDDIIYQAYNHPQLDGRFRMGISWELRD